MRLQEYHKSIVAMVILLLLTGLTQDVGARSRPDLYHYLGFNFSAGYSTFLEEYSDLTTFGSVGADLHFTYEFQDNDHGFWVSPSLGLQFLSSTATSSVHMQAYGITDTQGKTAGMYYDITSPLTENIRFLYFSFPIMLGWYSHNGFYVGAGCRLAFNLGLGSSSSLSYRTSGEYTEYFDRFRDMPNHFYTDYTATNDNVQFNRPFVFSAMGEIGYDVLKGTRKGRVKFEALKIAAFVDCEVFSLMDANYTGNICTIDPNNAANLIPSSYYNATDIKNHHPRSLYAGVKVTCLFLIKATKCPGCKRRNYNHKRAHR